MELRAVRLVLDHVIHLCGSCLLTEGYDSPLLPYLLIFFCGCLHLNEPTLPSHTHTDTHTLLHTPTPSQRFLSPTHSSNRGNRTLYLFTALNFAQRITINNPYTQQQSIHTTTTTTTTWTPHPNPFPKQPVNTSSIGPRPILVCHLGSGPSKQWTT